jgi:predicted dehydrogenase
LPERRDFRVAARLRTSLDVAGRTLLALRDALFPPRDTTFALALESFVAAARGGGPAKPDLDDGMASLAVVLAAERSARDGVRAAP